MRILWTADTTELHIEKSLLVVGFACPVCAIFFLDNFRNGFQLSVPLNTVPSVKMMADNDAIPVHSKAKGSKKNYG